MARPIHQEQRGLAIRAYLNIKIVIDTTNN